VNLVERCNILKINQFRDTRILTLFNLPSIF